MTFSVTQTRPIQYLMNAVGTDPSVTEGKDMVTNLVPKEQQ